MENSPVNVLMVEDNSDHAFLAKHYLEKANNYFVKVIDSFDECCAAIQKRKFDIILLDYNLPNEDGLTILNRLKQDDAIEIPIVVVTGYGHEEIAVEALKAGAVDYVVKNNDYPKFLPTVVDRVIDKHNIYREKKRVEAEVIVRNKELQVLNAVSEVLNQSLVLEEILNGAIKTITDKLELDGSAILLRDRHSNELTVKACDGVFKEICSESQTDFISNDLVQGFVANGHTSSIFDLEADPTHFPVIWEKDLSSLVVVPLEHKGKKSGLFFAVSRKSQFFSSRHLDLLRSVANQISIAVENAKLYKQTESLKNNLENVLNSSLDVMLTISPDHTIIFFNERFARFAHYYGLAQNEIKGKNIFEFIPEQSEKIFRKKIAELISGKPSIYELELLSRDGTSMPCLISQSPLKGGEHFLLVIKDISKVVHLQKQLVCSEKLSALGQMIAGAAHELNNPLAGISGYSQLLLEEKLLPQVRSDIEVILRETRRCQKIIKNLLTFARKHESTREPINANEIVDSVLKLQSYQMKIDGIEIEETLEQSLPRIHADYNQLQQVFVHLINNAYHALKESKNTPKRLAVHTENARDSVRIKVIDNGIGIADENKEKIFDPFFTTKEVGEGAGLGLSICFGIIESHNGKLHVESQLGQGSTFTLELPRS